MVQNERVGRLISLRQDKGHSTKSSGGHQHSKDFVNYGSANYKWIGGITNIFNYKSLSLLIQVDGKFGGKVFSSTALNGLRSGIGKNSLVGRGGVNYDGVLPDEARMIK